MDRTVEPPPSGSGNRGHGRMPELFLPLIRVRSKGFTYWNASIASPIVHSLALGKSTGHAGQVTERCGGGTWRPASKWARWSEDRTLRRWNTEAGQQVGEPLTGHKESVGARCCCRMENTRCPGRMTGRCAAGTSQRPKKRPASSQKGALECLLIVE